MYQVLNQLEIKIKKLKPNTQLPSHGSEQAAGYDLYADWPKPLEIMPHATVKIGTGIALEIRKGYFGAVYARSGLATYQKLRPSNCVGVIDSDYRGEIMVALHNDSNKMARIEPYERVAQLVIQRFEPLEFEEVDKLEVTGRGTGGFGSTGK